MAENTTARIRLRSVHVVQIVLAVILAATLPAAAVSRFGFDSDRGSTADFASVVFFGAILALLSTPWWPLPSERDRSTFQRIQSMCFVWFAITFTTHLTWELGWLVLHDPIVDSPDSPWAYIWWMYIDGGDGRYATSDPTLVTQEILSVINGIVGFTGLFVWFRSKGRAAAATLLLMSTAVVHLYSTAVYFGSEIFDGYPNVDTASFIDLWVKFLLLNGIWLVMPWVVLFWGWRTLNRQLRPIA
jgi:hypothetical protein